MKNLIRHSPNVFGAILLLGIVCSVYLFCFTAGNLLQAYVMPVNPEATANPLSYRFLYVPFFGMFICGLTLMACYILFLIGFIFKEMVSGVGYATKALGQWLLKKTSAL